MTYDLSWLISVDDHVMEPPDLWLKRLPSKFADRAPRLAEQDGMEVWLYEGKAVPTAGLGASMGTDKSTWTMTARTKVDRASRSSCSVRFWSPRIRPENVKRAI